MMKVILFLVIQLKKTKRMMKNNKIIDDVVNKLNEEIKIKNEFIEV